MSSSLIVVVTILLFVGLGVLFVWLTKARKAAEATPSASSRYQAYVRQLADAARALYGFLRELNGTPRFREWLNAQPSANDALPAGEAPALAPRLAQLVRCDIRASFRRLGYDPVQPRGLTGIGYAMVALLLADGDFDLSQFQNSARAAEILDDVGRESAGDADGADGKLAEALRTGHEWSPRYAALMHRWATLIAEADGEVTREEQAGVNFFEAPPCKTQ